MQTGYSSAQGQCTGQEEREETVDECRDGLSTAQLRGGRQGHILGGVCVVLCFVRGVYL